MRREETVKMTELLPLKSTQTPEASTDNAETVSTVMCLSIGTPKNNKFSICSKWKIHYFQVSQNLGTLQPNHVVLEYWDN